MSGVTRLFRHGWMSPFKYKLCVAQSRKRLFLLTTGGNGSDRRQLMGFISWPFMYKRTLGARGFSCAVSGFGQVIRSGSLYTRA